MEPFIISKRSKGSFYGSLIFTCLFLAGFGFGCIILYVRHLNAGFDVTKETKFPIIGSLLLILAVYMIYKSFRLALIIRISAQGISFNERTYDLAELDHVDFTGKRKYPLLVDYPKEALTLYFRNGDVRYMYDDQYENTWQVKLFIKKMLDERNGVIAEPVHIMAAPNIAFEEFEDFKGNPVFSFRGITLWGFVGFLIFMLITSQHPNVWVSFVLIPCLIIFWVTVHVNLMDYFKVSKNYLVIRNHYLPWRSRIYLLSDIGEVVYETQGKMPNCMRVITRDFRQSVFYAATLTDKTWLALKERLETCLVLVRNECIENCK